MNVHQRTIVLVEVLVLGEAAAIVTFWLVV